MRQPCFPFLIPGWRRSFIMMVFREENDLFFGQNKRFETAVRKTNQCGATPRRQKKPRTGGESCTGLYFWKWVVRHLVTMDHYFFRLNEEMMG